MGLSGSGKYHGYEGFKQFSNSKSVLIKPAMNFYPYNKVYPPFTTEKQGLLKGLMRYLGCSQKVMFKLFIWFLIFLWIVKLYLNGTLSMKNYRKWKKIFGMVGSMLPMLMK